MTDATMNAPLPEPFAAIAAFLDGEQVEAAALKSALATEGGREYLVDLLALRRSVATMGPATLVNQTPARRAARVSRWAAAVAAAALASMGGYVMGERASAAEQVRRLPGLEAVTTFSPSSEAPQPTVVIQLAPARGAAAGGQ